MKRELVEQQACLESCSGHISAPAEVPSPWIAAKLAAGADTRLGSRYLVALPEGYAREPQRRWPVVVFLHGSGQRGDDFATLRTDGLAASIDRGLRLPAIVVVPQLPAGKAWHPLFVDAVLREVEAAYRIDLERVALTGLSLGSMGAFSTALAFPQRFSAVAAFAGGMLNDAMAASAGLPLPPLESLQPALGRIAHLPFWLAHGCADDVVPVACSQRVAQALVAQGATVRSQWFAGVGHDAWTQVYEDTPDFYDWLLGAARPHAEPVAADDVSVFCGRYHSASGDDVDVTLDKGRLRISGLGFGGHEEVFLPIGGGDFVGTVLLRFRRCSNGAMRLIEPGLGELRRLSE